MMRSITKLVTLALFCLLNVNCAKNRTDGVVSISAASLKFSAAGGIQDHHHLRDLQLVFRASRMDNSKSGKRDR